MIEGVQLSFVSMKEMSLHDERLGKINLDILQRTDGEFVALITYKEIFIEGWGNTEVEAIKMSISQLKKKLSDQVES
jgi:hypothetical protein